MKGVCLNCTLKRSPENPGVVSESVTDGDEWPQVRERILAAENEATPIAFNRVAGVVVVGNEDGAHHCISEISGGGLARPAGQSDPGTTAELKGALIAMATEKQRAAAKRNVRKAQAAAKKQQTLKNLPAGTRTALGKEAAAVRRGDEPTRRELEAQARKLDIKGRSKMGKAELKRAVAQAEG